MEAKRGLGCEVDFACKHQTFGSQLDAHQVTYLSPLWRVPPQEPSELLNTDVQEGRNCLFHSVETFKD